MGAGVLGVVADRVVVPLGDDLLQLAVHEAQRDADRAEALAFAAVDAAAGEVDGAGDVPAQVAARMRRGLDPLRLRLLDDAALADAERADLAAGVAAHALVELLRPERPALLEGLVVQRRDALRDRHDRPRGLRLWLADEMVRQRRLAVVAAVAARRHVLGREGEGGGQLVLLEHAAAAHADQHYVVAADLRLPKEPGDGLDVAPLDDEPDLAELGDVVAPRVEVGDEVVHAARVEDELLRVGRVADEDRPGAASGALPADDDTHVAGLEELAGDAP